MNVLKLLKWCVLLIFIMGVLPCKGENYNHTCTQNSDWFLNPHRVCSFDRLGGLIDFRSIQDLNQIRFAEDDTVGICTHKRLVPIMFSELIGYFIIISIIVMVCFNDLLTEGFLVSVFLLWFEFNSLQSVGYMNLIAVIIFAVVFWTKANSKRNYKDLLAVDYLLITILLPLQIMGRIVGTMLNFGTNYIINFFAIYFGLVFVLYKFLFKLMTVSHDESKNDGMYSGKYISLSILKSSNALRDISDKSSSNSSFSVDSEMRFNNAAPYQIREESWEESLNKNDNLMFPSEASEQYSSKSYSIRKRGDVNKDNISGINQISNIKDTRK